MSATASALETTDVTLPDPASFASTELTHTLAPHFSALARFRTTRALHASPLYRQLRIEIERALNTVIVEDLRDRDTSIYGKSTYSDAPDKSNTCGSNASFKMDSIRAIAWNIERGIRLPGIINQLRRHTYLREADLLLLTEVDYGMARSGNLHVAREIAAELKLNYAFASCYLALDKGNGSEAQVAGSNTTALHGNALFSKHTLRNVHALRLPNGKDKLQGTEKRLGSQQAVIADVEHPRGTFRAVCLHLDAHSSQAHRAWQMRIVLNHLSDLDAQRQKLPVIIGGDWNTSGYNSRRAFYSILGFWRRVLMGVRHTIAHHYPYPERWFERHLFRELEQRGYRFRDLNTPGACTLHYDITDRRTRAQMADWIPAWCFPFINWALAPTEGRCSLKLDWFAGHSIAPAPGSPPKVVSNLCDKDATPLSDHDAILLDFQTLATNN